jgi:putative tryptophan/tyrosine transport system substrate-binding protein
MISRYPSWIKLVVLATALFGAEVRFVHAEKSGTILIVSNSSDEPYQQATTGFKSQFSVSSKLKFIELSLTQAKAGEYDLSRNKPDLIYTLGAESVQWASLQTTTTPIIATLVVKDDIFKKTKNVTGIRLAYPLNIQFQWLKKFFSPQKTVAILYNPQENAASIEAAQQISQQNGFKLNPIAVRSPKELPFALEQLSSSIDILFAIPDETVMSVNTAKEVLLASFRNKVPLVGLSDNWVKSGAFYALSWDYEDIGRQCATIAQKVMTGTAISALPPENPRKIAYTINTKIADHMNLDIPAELMKNAKKIFD